MLFPLCAALLLGLSADGRVVNRLGGADFTTLTAAVNAANPGETIEIDAAGNPYPSEGSLLLTQSGVTLTSRNGIAVIQSTQLIIDGANFTLDGVKLDGMHLIQNLMRITANASGCTVRSCEMVSPASGVDNGVAGEDLTDAGELTGSGCAIEIAGGGNVLIENNDLRFPVNSNLVNQVCILMQANPGGAHSGVVIRGNQFGAETRNISCIGGWDNVTIENNTFVRASVGTLRVASAILLLTEVNQPGAVSRNWTFQNNTFTTSDDSNICIFNAGVENVVIEGNDFGDAVGYNNVTLFATGGPVSITNNLFRDAGAYSIDIANSAGQPPSAAVGGVLISDNHFMATAAGISIGEDVNTGILVEDNQIDQITSNVVFSFTGGNSSGIVRNNHVSRGGSSSCVNLNANGAAVVDNYFGAGRRGIAMFGQDTFANAPGNNLVRGNLVIEPGLTGSGTTPIFGIGDWSGGGVSGYIASQQNRIINNTVVLSAGDGIFISAPGYQVYNNISAFNVDQGIDVDPGGAPTVLDFNLVFQNPGGNYEGTSGGPHSIATNPQFVTFFGVSAGADFHLKPQSAARNAGTSNGLDHDYVTELGAYQDVEVDTGVPVSGWELYR